MTSLANPTGIPLHGRRVSAFAISAGSVLGAMVIWQTVSVLGIVRADLLPAPSDVLLALRDVLREGYRGTTLLQNTLATLWRCSAGFLAACATGVPLGLAIGRLPRAGAAIDWAIQFLRPLPPLSFLVLLILWFGTGDLSKIMLLYLTAFPIIASAAAAGAAGVDQARIEAARSLGCNRAQLLAYVVLPSALPIIFTGMRIALAAAFSTVVAAELMAAKDGLGWMIFSASQFLRTDVIMLGIIILGILGMALARGLLALDRAVVHWRGRD